MKTTLDLPDDLFVAAKKQAADERRSFRDLVAQGLRAQVSGAGRRKRGRAAPAIAWVTVKGGLPEGMDLSDRDRMHDRLRRSS
jgi:hypothetical protein